MRPGLLALYIRIQEAFSNRTDPGSAQLAEFGTLVRVTLTEALKIVYGAPQNAPPFDAALICGFTPLHLQTFLAAHLQTVLPDRRVAVKTGLYGDSIGTLERIASDPPNAAAMVLEWPDIDSRLGYRSSGAWNPSATSDILTGARMMLDRLYSALVRIPLSVPAALCLPTLPLPPLFWPRPAQASVAQLSLRSLLAEFAARIASNTHIAIVDEQWLSQESPAPGRHDFKSDLIAGFPYTRPHAARLAEALAGFLIPRPPKKGLISDLDDTLWYGLVGEVGPDGVSWDLDSHHHIHGLYQKMLASFCEEGVLVGIASKNNPDAVNAAFRRPDILLPLSRVFPLEVHWEAKSGSVERILKTWNIGADSVVFVDDSPMELAEVAAAHPGIECLLFPKDSYEAACQFLWRLRDLFGKPGITQEDAIRADSIRAGLSFREQAAAGDSSSTEVFLAESRAVMTVDVSIPPKDGRALELVNKTNQFNLNGIRYTDSDWSAAISRPGGYLQVVSYEDKFGTLGKIAVLSGVREGDELRIHTWVMSCRAFARRIEHQCLNMLFETGIRQVTFAFSPTQKNGPIQDFFAHYLGEKPLSSFALSREQFAAHCPKLHHEVVSEARGVEIHG